MRIDPRQPIMFDTDTAPGTGAGYWQISPRPMRDWDDDLDDGDTSLPKDTLAGRIAQRLVFSVVLGGIALGALDMLVS